MVRFSNSVHVRGSGTPRASANLRTVPEPGADRWRPCGRIARGERIGRRVVHEIFTAPAGALHNLAIPSPRLREVAFAGECPPGEAAADASEHSANDRFLAKALYCERGTADADQPARDRQLLARAVPTATLPHADGSAMCCQVKSVCFVHAITMMQVWGQRPSSRVLK